MIRMGMLWLAVLLLWSPAQGQEKITVDKADLPPEVLRKVEAKKTVNDWAGLGKEVGLAVNGALEAVTTQTEKFSNTGVGKMTIALVVWKVIGHDVVRILAGATVWLIATPTLIFLCRRTCFSRSMLVKVNADKSREYKIVEPKFEIASGGLGGRLGAFFVAFVVVTIASSLIAFAG